MTVLLVAGVLAVIAAGAVWVVPWVALWLSRFLIWLVNRRIRAFNRRSAQRRADMSALLQQLNEARRNG